MRRELPARQTRGNNPLPTTLRTHPVRIERIPNSAAPAHPRRAPPTARRFRPPLTFRTEDLCFAHGFSSVVDEFAGSASFDPLRKISQ